MNFGKIDIGLGDKDRYTGNTTQLESDIARLVLLLLMILAAIVGSMVSKHFSRPDVIIQSAIKKTLGQRHQVDLEGTVSIAEHQLEMYRMRQKYDPENGLSLITSAGSSDNPPFNSVTVLELINKAETYTEHPMQDMYNQATKHFSCLIPDPNGDSSKSYLIDCWVESTEQFLVRVVFAGVRRNAGTAPDGEPVSEETYLNFWYHGYPQ